MLNLLFTIKATLNYNGKMNKKFILPVIGASVFLLYGLFLERHDLLSLSGGASKQITGTGLVEECTVDGILLKGGKLFDAYSAQATSSPKDCKT